MKVCLINPILFSFQRVRGRSLKNNIGTSSYPPLGICYIANVLEKNGIDVKIIDRNALIRENHNNQALVEDIVNKELRKFKPDVVGITVTTPTFFDAKNNIIKNIKMLDEEIDIVVGGPHASALPMDILQDNNEVDIVCMGEGEITMLEIAQGKKLEDISGIAYRNGTKIKINQTRKAHDNIDDFCFPARHLVNMQLYCKANPYVMHGLYMRSTTIFTSRSCAYDCSFCAGKVASGRTVRLQSPELVLEEIEKLIQDYNVEALYFVDDMFDIKKDRARTICRMLIEKRLQKEIVWNAQIRANTIDKELLKLMKEAGCVRVDVGFESGSQKTLDMINKRTTVAQNYEAARILHEVGIQFHANIIVGIPGEDLEDLNKTKKLMREIKPHWIGFGEFVPLPGSQLFYDLVDQGKIEKERVETMSGFNFTKLDDKAFAKFIKDVRNKIVIPTRLKYYIISNINKPGAYLFLARLAIGYLADGCRSILRLS